MGDNLTLALCWFFLLLVLRSPFLLAQVDKASPISKASEVDIHTCDSLKNPIPGESVADAARRNQAWRNCVESVATATERLTEHFVAKVDVDNGHLVAGAVPRLVDSHSVLVNRMDIYVRNHSPMRHQYTLTVRCGPWSRVLSASVDASDASQTHHGLGEPAFSVDVTPPCDLKSIGLEFSPIEKTKDTTQPRSASVVPGVSDEEMAQRLRSLQGSAATEAQGTAGNSISDLQRRVDEACKRQPLGELATAPVSSVGDHMTACAKAYDDLEAAMKAQAEVQKTVPSNKESPQPPSLIALACRGYYQPASGYNHVEGEIQNVSPVPIYTVYAVVSWYTDSGEFVKSDSSRIQFDPILPKQISPFEVLMPGNPAMTRFRLAFRTFDGATLPTEAKCSAQ